MFAIFVNIRTATHFYSYSKKGFQSVGKETTVLVKLTAFLEKEREKFTDYSLVLVFLVYLNVYSFYILEM